MSAPQRTFAGRNFSLAPKNVLALCHTAIGVNTAGNRAAAADFIVVHDDKPAEIRDTIMIVNHERPACFNHEPAYVVSLQLLVLVDLRF